MLVLAPAIAAELGLSTTEVGLLIALLAVLACFTVSMKATGTAKVTLSSLPERFYRTIAGRP